jgi:DNA-binding transcriptional MerR regulator
MKKALRTSDIARAVGIHPNTVRMYEQWGLLPPIPRTPKGYRQYNNLHLEQVKLIRLALKCTMLWGEIAKAAYGSVRSSAAGDKHGALELAYRLLEQVKLEKAQAEIAVELLSQWTPQIHDTREEGLLHITEAAKVLNVTVDMLRNWERNGLIRVPRHPESGYRLYGQNEINRLRIIRTLLRAKYSAMAVLRMMRHLDMGQDQDLRHVLDTPEQEEDVLSISDRWLSALSEVEAHAREFISQVQRMAALY